MIKSTFLSIGFHVFFILIAYYGLPSIKAKEIVEQPIDIVEDTPVSSKTSLKLGNKKIKKAKKVDDNLQRKINKKNTVPPPPLKPKDKVLEREKEVIKKLKETKKIAQLIKKKPVLKIKKINVIKPPKIRKKLIVGDRTESPCNKCTVNGQLFGQASFDILKQSIQ